MFTSNLAEMIQFAPYFFLNGLVETTNDSQPFWLSKNNGQSPRGLEDVVLDALVKFGVAKVFSWHIDPVIALFPNSSVEFN